jgi:hypothetical protein
MPEYQLPHRWSARDAQKEEIHISLPVVAGHNCTVSMAAEIVTCIAECCLYLSLRHYSSGKRELPRAPCIIWRSASA